MSYTIQKQAYVDLAIAGKDLTQIDVPTWDTKRAVLLEGTLPVEHSFGDDEIVLIYSTKDFQIRVREASTLSGDAGLYIPIPGGAMITLYLRGASNPRGVDFIGVINSTASAGTYLIPLRKISSQIIGG